MTTEKKNTSETRGEKLRRLRKTKGLSLEEVHQGTKIHIQVLKALEEDTISKMSPAYVKGLLKVYCKFLGVGHQEFIEEFKKKEETLNLSFTAKPQTNIPVVRINFRSKPVILLVTFLLLILVFFKIGKAISIHRLAHPKDSTPAIPVSKVAETSVPTAAVTKPMLGIRAKENSWLEVKVDGKTVFKNILKKGNFEQWEAKDKIEFTLGNAAGVDVEVNGKLFSPLGRRGQIIKNIAITKEGLKVPK